MNELISEISYKGVVKAKIKSRVEHYLIGDAHVMADGVNGAIIIAHNGKQIFRYNVYGLGIAIRHYAITDSYIDKITVDCIKAFEGTILAKYFK